MIQTQNVIINNRQLVHTYSDENRYVVRDNIAYGQAYDLPQFNYTYTEGELIPQQEGNPEEILSILLGGE